LSFGIERWTRSAHGPVTDEVVTEEPLEIRVRAGALAEFATLAVTMRTPGNDVELAVGFLYGEGLLGDAAEIEDARSCQNAPNVVQITLRTDRDLKKIADSRRFYTTSSCGLCGRSSLEAVASALKGRRVSGQFVVSAELLTSLAPKLRAEQAVFDATGGLHGCAMFDPQGNLLAVREDVGRHNAVDKLLGRAFLDRQLPATERILVLSGRAGFELIQKAVMAGVSVVAAVGAPTSLSVELARSAGQTLVGFLGANRMNVYAAPERIRFDA
jgi:FdhD protein